MTPEKEKVREMTVWYVRRKEDLKLMLMAYTKRDAAMQLQRRIDDGRFEGTVEDYLISKEA